jgi:DNA mismatch repair protein MutS2
VLVALASHCRTALGSELARELPFPDTRAELLAALDEGREAIALAERGEPIVPLELQDVREALGRLRIGAVLSPAELFAISRMLESARSLRRFLQMREERCPALCRACATDPSLDRVARDVGDAFDVDGTLKDEASPRLKELRGEQRTARARMTSRLEELLRKHAGIVQDTFIAEREGRFVIPIRADAHERFPGLVHSASGSGATLFVEPRVVIPLGNRLKVLDGEVTREENAIYGKLSGILHEHLGSIEGAAQALARADVRSATALLAAQAGLFYPQVVDEPRARLLTARHLLLVLDGVDVVPSDIHARAGHALVVSGPNAGGKTVALKSLGLSVLGIRAGLPIAADPSSVVGIFDSVLTDVGDEQSLEKNLSTFSAQMKNLSSILEAAHSGSLVLLDEVATGTDPREGEALAAGILDSLTARGAAALVTTHYEGLKALALVSPNFENASVGFDIGTMSPTFKLTVGVPGSSSALAVAARFGVPSTVIDRARSFLSKEQVGFEELTRKLSLERAALELSRARAEEELRAAQEERARLAAEIERVKERRHDAVEREAQALAENVRRAREDIRAARARLKQRTVSRDELVDIERAVNRVAGDVGAFGPLEPGQRERERQAEEAGTMPAAELKKGKRVYVARLRAEAEIVEISGTTARVAAGALKLTVPISELRRPGSVEAPREGKEGRDAGRNKPAEGPRRASDEAKLEVPFQTSDNVVDVRGMLSDDAVSMAMTFLDRAVGQGLRVVFVIHGHGTGALRDAIRRELKTSRYVAFSRPGAQNEGGDGATIVWLT